MITSGLICMVIYIQTARKSFGQAVLWNGFDVSRIVFSAVRAYAICNRSLPWFCVVLSLGSVPVVVAIVSDTGNKFGMWLIWCPVGLHDANRSIRILRFSLLDMPVFQ